MRAEGVVPVERREALLGEFEKSGLICRRVLHARPIPFVSLCPSYEAPVVFEWDRSAGRNLPRHRFFVTGFPSPILAK